MVSAAEQAVESTSARAVGSLANSAIKSIGSYGDDIARGGISQADEVANNAARAGLTSGQLVQKSATLAERAIGGTGRFAGTAKHSYATDLLERYQGIYGNRGLQFKVPFNNGPGNRGFLDVIDNTNGIIYDWKFGYPSMTPAQLNMTPQMLKYQRNFGFPTQVIKP